MIPDPEDTIVAISSRADRVAVPLCVSVDRQRCAALSSFLQPRNPPPHPTLSPFLQGERVG